MTRFRGWIGALVAGFGLLSLGVAGPALAQLSERQWLPAGSRLEGALSRRPAEPRRGGGTWQVKLGELAFLAPQTLGGKARRLGLSCAACHPGGGANTDFFLPGLSDKPGNVDMTGDLFDPRGDDGVFNPVNIPALHGVYATAPYGHDGAFGDLRAFSRHVIVDEFLGSEPPGWLLDALAAYLRDLDISRAIRLDARGRLPADIPSAVRRGETLFHRPFDGAAGPSCATCHQPRQAFTDRQRHDLGEGRLVDTPSLYGLTASAPYFHDGRFDDLDQVLAHFEARFRFRLTAPERRDLRAYLTHIGRPLPVETVSLEGDLERVLRLKEVLAAWDRADAAAPVGFAASVLRHLLGRIAERFPGRDGERARAALVAWSTALRDFARALEAGREFETRDRFATMQRELPDWLRRIRADEALSLYRPQHLRRALAPGNQG